MKDNLLRFIEVWAARLQNWAWNKRWKNKKEGTGYQEEWITGYKKWRKQQRQKDYE